MVQANGKRNDGVGVDHQRDPRETTTIAALTRLHNEMKVSKLHNVEDRYKPFHLSCQFACSGFRLLPRQQKDEAERLANAIRLTRMDWIQVEYSTAAERYAR